jgi:UDP-N-acetylmuramyl pentapeptide phosphotransferase/UDP-N-acetylglucosamine-1-phosphate transferase
VDGARKRRDDRWEQARVNAATIIAVASAVTTAATLPLVRRALVGRGVLDHATSRSSHQHATPRGGGLSILLGFVVAVGVSCFLAPAGGLHVWAAVAAVAALTIVGFLDDLKGLPPLPRILVQLSAGGALGVAASPEHSPLTVVAIVLGCAITMILVVNTVNFMDGINGITAITMMAWGASILWATSATDMPVGLIAGAAALGTGAAFLPFNAPRAKLFLGDVGSYLYGAVVASTSVVLLAEGLAPLALLAPLVPYLADVIATLLRRALRGDRLSDAHREHFYQAMTVPGRLPHVWVAVAYGALSMICAALTQVASTGTAIVGIAIVATVISVGPSLVRQRASGGASV